MQHLLRVFLAGALILGTIPTGMAATGSQTYTVSATVPAATSVSINASKVNSTTNVFTPVTGTALSFDPLRFDTTNQIFMPEHYFAISAGPANGGGNTDVTVSYAEGSNPNAVAGGSGHGLGWKTSATFVKVEGATETPLSSHGPKKLLKSLSSERITSTELGSGVFRMYVGVVTNPTAPGEPAGAEVISGADKTGSYTGSLVVSATVT
jgi:hypothetical protein